MTQPPEPGQRQPMSYVLNIIYNVRILGAAQGLLPGAIALNGIMITGLPNVSCPDYDQPPQNYCSG